MKLMKLVEQRLEALCPVCIEVVDESDQHIGHPGARAGAAHLFVHVVSSEFSVGTQVQHHRKVYALLSDLIPEKIHALRLLTEAA